MAKFNRVGLRIPDQSPAKGRLFYLSEKDTAEWVERLPLANIGETSRQLFQSLREFNRTTLPYKKRLVCAEMFRDPVSYVGSSLSKYYIDIGFPLTKKAHKIAVLNRELHNGLATAYKCIIVDNILTNKGRSDHRLLTIAIHRAIQHLSRIMLLTVLVYDSFPKWIWLELHILHRLACRYNLESIEVKDPLEAHGKSSNIDQAYRRILLFCLASPYKIRQRENIQIFDALLEWSSYTRFCQIDEALSDTTIFIQQDSDIAPCHGTLNANIDSNHVLKLDVTELIHKLREQFNAQPEIEALWGIESLDKNLLKQLIQLWSNEQKRSFVRTKLNFELRVAVGISNIYQLARRDLNDLSDDRSVDQKKSKEDGYEILYNFTIEPVEAQNHTKIRRNNFEDFGPNSQEQQEIDPVVTIWDKDEHKQRLRDTFLFQTLNESAGGYCLDWRGGKPPKILVGELIGVQSSMVNHQFGIGLVRWMKSDSDNSMQVGVQMIAPDAIAVAARKTNSKHQAPHECLLLPEVGTSGQPTSFICPSFPFKVGDLLIIDDGRSTHEVKLTRLLESSGAITQFQFIYLDQSGVTDKHKDSDDEFGENVDFDNLWSTL